MVCGEASVGAPQGAPAEEAKVRRGVSESVLKTPLATKIRGGLSILRRGRRRRCSNGIAKKWLLQQASWHPRPRVTTMRSLANRMTSAVVLGGDGSNCSCCYTQTPATTSRYAAATSGFPATREGHSNRAVFPNCERRLLTQWPSASLSDTIRAAERH